MIDKLESGLNILGIKPSVRQLEQLNIYMRELELWNSRLNLVSFQDREQLVVRHVLDCLAGLDIIQGLNGRSIADIGSGAGLPGLLLAIFLEDSQFSLVERSGKKAGFLRTTAALLDLVGRVEILDTDLKNVDGKFDIVVLRAFREFGDFIVELKKITAVSGTIAAYKGRRAAIESDLEAAGIKPDKADIRKLKVPFLDEERHIVLISE